jgi:hypothetical protein
LGTLLLSVLANILSTLIEYGIIKPNFEVAWNPLLSQSGNRDWSTAVKNSIQKLKSTQGGHVIPLGGEQYRVEDVHIEKGKGTVTLVVLPKSALVFAFRSLSFLIDTLEIDEFPHVIARYQIIIDRSGDILSIKSFPISENERYRPLYSPKSRFFRFSKPNTSFKFPEFPEFPEFPDSSKSFQGTNSPQKGLVLKIKKPVKELTSSGLKIKIGFTVENWGEATTIYPYVQYKVAELKSGKFEERMIHSPSNWKIELKAFCSQPMEFNNTLPFGTQLLAKGKDSVHVKISRKPWASTH